MFEVTGHRGGLFKSQVATTSIALYRYNFNEFPFKKCVLPGFCHVFFCLQKNHQNRYFFENWPQKNIRIGHQNKKSIGSTSGVGFHMYVNEIKIIPLHNITQVYLYYIGHYNTIAFKSLLLKLVFVSWWVSISPFQILSFISTHHA